MKEKFVNIIITLFILMIIVLGILFLIELKDFYDDYKCSTTTDVNYYIDNNCRRFEK